MAVVGPVPPAWEESMSAHVRVPALKEITDQLPLFDGFPYLVTRIVGAFRHVALVPSDWTENELRRLAKHQASANRLETCLVLGPDRAIFYGLDAQPSRVVEAPRGGLLVTGKLQAPTDFPQTKELVERTRRLEGYIAALDQGGYLIGDSDATYRQATPEELASLAGRDSKGVLRGLKRCAACGEYRGACLGTAPVYVERVTTVYCRCENHNLCARCCEPLAEWRLNANHFDRRDGHVWHLPAFSGLGHRCSSSWSATSRWWIGMGQIQ
jgi:hypothetical protein